MMPSWLLWSSLSKIVQFCSTTSDVDTVESAKLFFNHWYRHYGLPRKIVSDRDGRFVGKFWQELFRLVQVHLAMSSSHHPQTDGQTERTNRKMEDMLHHYVNYRLNNWDEVLPRWNTLVTTLSMPPPGKCRLSCFMDRSRWNSKTSCCRHQLPQLTR
jgi:transposase InsO family protein